MNTYIAIVAEHEEEFRSTRKSEIKKFAIAKIKEGAESVDVHAVINGDFGSFCSYIGSFYNDGEMPRIFNK